MSRAYSLLVVDDSEDSRLALARGLKAGGYDSIALAGDGEHALRVLAERPCDLVLLDVALPGLAGRAGFILRRSIGSIPGS